MTRRPMRDVRTRRIDFSFGGGDRHFVGHDILQSHLLTLGSAVFPEGEDFFVRSVRRYRDAIEDAELRRQVGGFIGQEAMHGREHRSLNDHLARLGYPTRFIDRFNRFSLLVTERLFPPAVRLAITAALEHYTATLAWVLLTEPDAQAAFIDDEIRTLFLWHALEETEHKAVAFDVLEEVSGDDAMRRRVMRIVTADLLVGTVAGLVVSLSTDPSAWRPSRLRASARALKASPFWRREVLDRIRDYNRPGFHPDDHDTAELVAEWRARLFGDDEAPLAGRVR